MYTIKSRLHNKLGFEVWVVDGKGNTVFTCYATMLQDGFDQAEAAIERLTA
jgi:hypothetical protein